MADSKVYDTTSQLHRYNFKVTQYASLYMNNNMAAVFTPSLDYYLLVIFSIDGAATMLALHQSELQSENKRFKSCFFVVLWTDLTKHEFNLQLGIIVVAENQFV